MLGEDQMNEKGSWGGCQRKTDFCLSVGKSFPWKGVGAALAVLRGSRDHAELTLGSPGVGLSGWPLAGPEPLHVFRVCRAGKPGPRFKCGFADCRRQYCAWHVVIVSCWILLFTSTLSLEMFKCLGFFKALFNSEIGSFNSAGELRRQMSRTAEADCGRAPRAGAPAYELCRAACGTVGLPRSSSAASQTVCWADIWYEASPGRLIIVSLPAESLPRAQIGRRAVGTFLSDDGLAVGRPGAKGQKEKREAGKSNQRMFMLEGVHWSSASSFHRWGARSSEQGAWAEAASLVSGEPGPKDKAFFQISHRSVSAHWLSCVANGQSKRLGGVLRWRGFTRQPPYTCRWNQSTMIGIFTMLPSKR